MAASILNSDKAIEMNIMIVRAFIALKQFAVQYKDLSEQLNEVKNRVGEHDVRLNQIYEAIENLLYEKEEKKRWENRKPIGFKTGVPQTAKG